MGSRKEFEKAVKFVDEHKIRPVVDTVLPSLEDAEEGFQLMKSGGQFGKVSQLLQVCLESKLISSTHRSSSTSSARRASSEPSAESAGLEGLSEDVTVNRAISEVYCFLSSSKLLSETGFASALLENSQRRPLAVPWLGLTRRYIVLPSSTL